ncbi:MAG TPA: DUF559 domain-containing protein, partial [Candidatus Ventricola gallistercoris]|nr:DUF559 domain-containing protein [Candidatus Ventricola gallistercoris]
KEDILLILDWLSLQKKREQLGLLWNDLVAPCGEPQFDHLGKDPERACRGVAQEIGIWLNWMDEEYPKISYRLNEAGLQVSLCESFIKPMAGDYEATKRLFDTLQCVLRPAARIVAMVSGLAQFEKQQDMTLSRLHMAEASVVCKALESALLSTDTVAYENAMVQLSALVRKIPTYQRRMQIIEKIAHVAPNWSAELIHRVGVHGKGTPPECLEDAWSLKQMETRLVDIANTSLSDALAEVTRLTSEYRKKTAKLAATMAWYELLLRIQKHRSMQTALIGWKHTIRKIGKGTGKNAAMLKKRAQELMAQCQMAVPAWIMPIGKVMDSIDPRKTRFDVVIIDEASQSDVTAMVLLYIGKKVIIVGDDEQVSPMAIGTKSEKIQELQNIYLRDKLPNWHLYTPTDSLYDIAARSYRAMMLREHFRCVPDIIRYCNYLCYNGKIRPLREAGNSPVLPPIVSYNAQGERNGKTNLIEAETIVSLIMACMEQPEYDGQTFGVISMLGDDQVKLVDRLLYEKIDLPQREERQILCGNASNFQGDERDVVFLTLVDSNASDGPLNLFSDRKENKQRYNVAVSRAKNQLFIVHSLDYTRDLKAGDLRRGLLEYADDPGAREMRMEEAAEYAESPFETEVAQALIARGYHIEQQHEVGSYRIDMIAICGNKRVAIECDGERWHSTPEQIAQDMSRQEILERLGWTFIRIRGSEYYLHREKVMERVVQQLTEYSIMPESTEQPKTSLLKDSTLLKTVKRRAQQIRDEWHEADLSGAVAIPESTGTLPAEKTMEVHEAPSIMHSEKKAKASQPSNNVNAAVSEPSVAAKPDAIARKERRGAEQPQVPLRSAQKAKRVAPLSDEVEPDATQIKQISIDEVLQGNTAGLTLYEELAQNGFMLIDNRKTSGIIWVLYDKMKNQVFNQIMQAHRLQPCLEMRGSIATANKPAWRIMEKKEGK